jgi:hypothetical protein
MSYQVTGTTHIHSKDITFSLKVDVEHLDSASLAVEHTGFSVPTEKRGEHLHAVVPKFARVSPPAEDVSDARYEAFAAAIRAGNGISLGLNIQIPLLEVSVALEFKEEAGGRYAVSNI